MGNFQQPAKCNVKIFKCALESIPTQNFIESIDADNNLLVNIQEGLVNSFAMKWQ